MSETWRESKRLFQEALAIPPEDRIAFLESSSESEAVIRHVQTLLASHRNAEGFLEFQNQTPRTTDWLGKRLGDFQIVKLIGRGGHGSVFEAIQQHPRRHVAIKILRDDFHIPEKQRRRFEFESEALASLKHPGIAHVYARGELTDGPSATQPWFAMELVRGRHLMEFVRQENLNQKQRLHLFLRICDAVQHAHEKQIIHRDLKPANILIPSDNKKSDSPQPKIVDFGIAKSLAADPAADPTRDIVGTLDYLSPEQVCSEAEAIDFRTDIYSLGVVLYQLLTGQLPHDRSSGPLTKVVQRILAETSPRFYNNSPRVPKDLQSIVGKSMASRPADRYRTVQHLRDDVQRFLNCEPVVARRPSLGLSVLRFTQRNTVLVSLIVATFAILSTGIFLYAREARLAREAAERSVYEATKATAVSSFITNDFLTQLLAKSRSGNLNAEEIESLVSNTSKLIGIRFGNSPKIEAAIHNELGTILYNVQRFNAATGEYRLALTLWTNSLGANHADSLKALSNLAQSELALGLSDRAETLCQEAYERRLEVLGDSDRATLQSLNNYAEVLRKLERYDEAAKLYQKGLSKYRNGLTPDVTFIALAANFGSLLLKQGDPSKALQLHEEVYERAKTILGQDHVLTLRAAIRLVQTLDRTGAYPTAWKQLQPVLKIYEAQAKKEPTILITPYRLAARVCRHLGKPDEAIRFLVTAKKAATDAQQESQIRRIDRELRRLKPKTLKPKTERQSERGETGNAAASPD